jgi:hypothetical protein
MRSKPEATLPFSDRTAAGLVRESFAFTPAWDLLFAAGWPHLRTVVDQPMDDQAAVEAVRRVLEPLDPTPRHQWGRRLAQGYVRAIGLPAPFELTPDEKLLRQSAEEVLWNPDPLRPDEVVQGIETRMQNSLVGVSDRTMENWLLYAEALVGTSVVAGAIVDMLEQLPVGILSARWTLPPFITYQLGYLLLRLTPPESTVLRDRLHAVLERGGGAPQKGRATWEDGFSHLRAVHLVLAGSEAAKRGGDRNLGWYTHVADDPTFVRMRVSMDRLGHRPNARLIFLGGAEVLSSYLRRWQKLEGEEQRWFFRQIAPIRSLHTAAIVLEMSQNSAVKEEASRWFVEHPDFVQEWLVQQVAADGPLARAAERHLRAIKAL